MKKIVLVFGFLLTISFQVWAQWFAQQSGTTYNINDVSFIDKNNGTAVGSYGLILRTTNGGVNWVEQISGVADELLGVSFSNINIGTAVSNQGKIIRTTNGGTNWTLQSSGVQSSILAVCFTDSNTGTAVGFELILRTTDGGTTWSYQSSGLTGNFEFNGVSFSDINNGIICGYSNYNYFGLILRTTNGGETWTPNTNLTPQNIYLTGVSVIDSNNAWVVGENATILSTADGGITWIRHYTNLLGGTLYNVKFIDENNGWIVGSNIILGTTNAGTTWTEHNLSGLLTSVCFIDTNNGWAVGWFGKILHTTNGGVTFIEDEENNFTQPKEFLLLQNYPNPFNPSTSIQYAISTTQFVTLKVYDLLGREVATLINEEKTAGSYKVEFGVQNLELSSGIYFYKLQAGDFIETKKMILLK